MDELGQLGSLGLGLAFEDSRRTLTLLEAMMNDADVKWTLIDRSRTAKIARY